MLDAYYWAWVTSVVACGLYGLYRWVLRKRRDCYNAFEDTGIPGPPIQSLITGNSEAFWNPTLIESLNRWVKEYGDVFGFYLGDVPIVVTKDLDMIKEIYTKNFTNFTGRGHIMHIYEVQPLLADSLVFSKGSVWKEIRSTMCQFFTGAKLAKILPSLSDAQRQFIEILGANADSGTEVDIDKLCERFTFDAVARAAFGFDSGVQRNPKAPIFQSAIAVVPTMMAGFVYNMGQSLYHWSWLLKAPVRLLSLFAPDPLSELTGRAKDVIEFRRKNPQVSKPDMAQILLDDALRKREKASNGASKPDSRAPLPAITIDKIAANCMFVFLGGYDPTRLALTAWFFVMGKHPDVQERMREEALEAFKAEGDDLSLETLTKLPYTNQVISETLRMFPPVITSTTRRSETDCRVGKYLIKKGTSTMVATYQLHYDPLYWENPEKFDPDRFSPERKPLINPLAYQPFGLGVRKCIGQRLALLELASVTTQVLQHFRITLGPSQKPDMELATYGVLAVPKGVWIQVHRLASDK